jgi:hypothetical protein
MVSTLGPAAVFAAGFAAGAKTAVTGEGPDFCARHRQIVDGQLALLGLAAKRVTTTAAGVCVRCEGQGMVRLPQCKRGDSGEECTVIHMGPCPECSQVEEPSTRCWPEAAPNEEG